MYWHLPDAIMFVAQFLYMASDVQASACDFFLPLYNPSLTSSQTKSKPLDLFRKSHYSHHVDIITLNSLLRRDFSCYRDRKFILSLQSDNVAPDKIVPTILFVICSDMPKINYDINA